MKIEFSHHQMVENIEALASAFDAEIRQDCNERHIALPEKHGTGGISCFVFDFGVSLLLVNACFKSPLQIKIPGSQPHPIHFHFCVKGDFRHTLNGGALSYQMNPLMGSISTTPVGAEQELWFAKGVETVHTNLQIVRAEYLQKADCDLDRMPERLAEVFRDTGAAHPYLNESNYNLPTAECIREIIENRRRGLTRSTFVEGKAMQLLSLQLRQFAEDQDPETRFVALKKYDLEQILKAKELLVEDLQNEMTIVELARAVGINQQKLKQGFKQVFGVPIKQYLRNTRLETARVLIQEGTMSVRAAATQVGYHSQSHFSKKFKEKFGVLPKDLKKMVTSEVPDHLPKPEAAENPDGPILKKQADE